MKFWTEEHKNADATEKLRRATITKEDIVEAKLIWSDTHKGLFYKVVLWNMHQLLGGIWNSYIHIPEDKVPEELFDEWWLEAVETKLNSGSKFTSYKYYETSLREIDFHGGITHYSKGLDSKDKKVIVVGNDHNHLNDDSELIDRLDVERDVKKAIDSLIKLIEEYKPKIEESKDEQ